MTTQLDPGRSTDQPPPPRGRPPWWLRLVLGLLCVLVGAVLVLRPFASLSVLVVVAAIGLLVSGVAMVSTARRLDAGPLAVVAGLVWVAAGIVALVWPDITTRGLAGVVGVAMVVGGVLEVVAGLRGSTDERLAAVIGGLATVVFGVLALGWPDVTVLVVAVVLGVRTMLFGIRVAWSAVTDRDGTRPGPVDHPRGPLRRFGHAVVTVGALVLALVLAGISVRLHEGRPAVDSFYTPPADVPQEPGVLLRAEPFDRQVPDDALGWRILYTTTRDDGSPAVASGLVVTPRDAAAPTPVIAWAHGTTGVARECAPSVLDDTFGSGAFFLLDDVVREGWTLVATDYVGLGTEGPHPYLIGQGEARSVLDAVRAARTLEDARLSDRTVVWGHSQGGNAALWTGTIAPAYAPDVPLDGVAALAPASDLTGLMDNLPNVSGGSIFATYVLEAYAATYPDVRLADYVLPAARTTFDEMAERCLGEPAVLVSVLTAVAADMTMFSGDLTSGPLADRLVENTPPGPIEAPLLLGQGAADSLVKPAVQDAYVERLCAQGQPVDYRRYDGRDHVPLVEPDSPLVPELLEWTRARLAGEPPTPTCGGT